MTNLSIGLLLICLFLVLMFNGVPIAVSLATSSIITTLLTNSFSVTAIIHRLIGNANSYVLLAIPFFILAAKLMNYGTITNRIFRFATSWVGFIPGGLGHANVLASIIFSGMSGSAVADAGGLGQIEIQAMKDEGFEADFAAAVTAASATIGPIIPPSVPMVVYGMMTDVSVGALFMAGVIPGFLLGLSTMIFIFFVAKKRHYPRHKFSWHEIGSSTKAGFLSLMTPVIIIGGIWGGVFSPTEAAIVASVYAFLLTVVLYKEMTLKQVFSEFISAAVDSSIILFIICGAASFSWLVAMLGLTDAIATGMVNITNNKYFLLLIINVVMILLGMFMEALSVMTILVPFLVPLMAVYNLNPIHIGVVIVLNLMIGLITPPVGTSLFICAKQAGITIEEMYKAIMPFLVPLVIVLLLITFVPGIVLLIPNAML